MQLTNTLIAQGEALNTAGDAAKDTVGMVSGLWNNITGSFGSQLGEFLPKLLGALVILVVG